LAEIFTEFPSISKYALEASNLEIEDVAELIIELTNVTTSIISINLFLSL